MVEEGPILPEGSGDAESPAWIQRQLRAYERGLEAASLWRGPGKKKVRRSIHGYRSKNCEEAYVRGGGG